MSIAWTDGLDALPDAPWTDVLSRSRRPSPFLSPPFLRPWAASFAADRGPRVARWERNGRVDELLFLCRRPADPGWELLGGEDVADVLDAVVADGLERDFWAAFLGSAADLLSDGPLVLPNVVDGSATLPALVELCAGAGLALRVAETDRAPYVPLPASFDAYLEALGSKERHELRRKMRRAEAALPGLSFRTSASPDELSRDLSVFIDLHRRSSPAKRAFMTDRMAAFFRETAARFFALGQLRLSILSGDRGEAAAAFQIESGGVRMLYNSGFDPDVRGANPGVVLVAHSIREAIDRGLGEFDFLRGTERYKYDLGGRDRAVYRAVIEAS